MKLLIELELNALDKKVTRHAWYHRYKNDRMLIPFSVRSLLETFGKVPERLILNVTIPEKHP